MAPKAAIRVTIETEDGDRKEGELVRQWIRGADRFVTIRLPLDFDADADDMCDADDEADRRGKGKKRKTDEPGAGRR